MSSSNNFDEKKPSTSKGSTSSGVKSLAPTMNKPLALASHDEVVNDHTLFMNTLLNFHFDIGSKLVIPVVGKKDLNLHGLYVEVTRRGGFEKVVKEKKWREVGNTFGFPNTATSASYALKKHYSMILHRYELVYYHKKNVDASANQAAGEESFLAVGTIEGKFECGYIITMEFGDETYQGVLYYPNICSRLVFPTQTPSTSARLPPHPPLPHAPQQLARRSRKRRRADDPDRPKPNRSGYNFFFKEKHTALKSVIPEREREFTKMIGNAWTNLPDEQKLVYNNYASTDKERYRKELQEYQEKKSKGKAIA